MSDLLAAIPALSHGSHDSPAEGMSVMEAVGFVAGEPFSDRPACVCPVISAFLSKWNDFLPDDERNALLRPLIPGLIGTRATPEVERRRAVLAADWLIRTHTSAWLRLAGLTTQADALAGLPEITDVAQYQSLMPALKAARQDMAVSARTTAAWDAAWEAAGSAAIVAAKAAASWDNAQDAAAWDAKETVEDAGAQDAAWEAVASAAWDASWAAAASAAWNTTAGALNPTRLAGALNPTRLELQRSALDLVERMIAVA